MTELSREIRGRGHYEILIRPEQFVQDRITFEELWPTLQRTSLSLRGWDFPHLGREETLERLEDSIRQSADWQHFREVWRFFQSGQFAYLGSIHEDWLERHERIHRTRLRCTHPFDLGGGHRISFPKLGADTLA